MGSKSWFQRPVVAQGRSAEAEQILEWLTPDLTATLGGLHEAPQAVADAVVQLLPFGSRAAMCSLGLAVLDGPDPHRTGGSLSLTPLAYQVIAAAAARMVADPAGISDWTRQAEHAAFPQGTGRSASDAS